MKGGGTVGAAGALCGVGTLTPQQEPAMAEATQSRTNAAKKSRAPAGQDAIELLKADHKEVAAMFKEFESADGDEKQQLAQQICKALTVHAQIEEEIFYPAAYDALGEEDSDLLDEAEVEHGSIKDLVEAIESDANDDLFDAKVKVMGEWVKHHVKEEETEMFPKLQKTDMDMAAIGAELAERKAELMAESEDAEGEEDDAAPAETDEDDGEDEKS
jgi:hemerythrin superfamily protein